MAVPKHIAVLHTAVNIRTAGIDDGSGESLLSSPSAGQVNERRQCVRQCPSSTASGADRIEHPFHASKKSVLASNGLQVNQSLDLQFRSLIFWEK